MKYLILILLCGSVLAYNNDDVLGSTVINNSINNQIQQQNQQEQTDALNRIGDNLK